MANIAFVWPEYAFGRSCLILINSPANSLIYLEVFH